MQEKLENIEKIIPTTAWAGASKTEKKCHKTINRQNAHKPYLNRGQSVFHSELSWFICHIVQKRLHVS